MRELDLERNRPVPFDTEVRPAAVFRSGGSQFGSYAAACSVAMDLVFQLHGVEAALVLADEMWQLALDRGMTALSRYLQALRVDVLGIAGLIEQGEERWRDGKLPDTDEACLDLNSQSWLEMEAFSCTRLRLLAAGGEFAKGRNLVRDLLGVTFERGLRRTGMRALALAVSLEESAGNRSGALGHLTEFLELYAETDYARSIVRERVTAIPVLTAFLKANPGSARFESAQRLLAAAQAGAARTLLSLGDRETEILNRLATQADKEIATDLGLTASGVRYHIRRLFAKLQVNDRRSAVRRARELGIVQGGNPSQ